LKSQRFTALAFLVSTPSAATTDSDFTNLEVSRDLLGEIFDFSALAVDEYVFTPESLKSPSLSLSGLTTVAFPQSLQTGTVGFGKRAELV
jgi:hypothetical protein